MPASAPARTRGILRSKSERSSPTRRGAKNKKNVRFLDCVDLEQAQYQFGASSSGECDVVCDTRQAATSEVYNPPPELQLEKQFWLPTEDELRWLTSSLCVHLESVRWFGRAITGVVRVANIQFEKKVEIRYTYDDWATSHITNGSYSGSPCTNQDQFSFCIFLPYLRLDMRLFFCIRYECAGSVFWDSNGGANYKFICRSANLNRNPFFLTDCSIFF
ncbi:Protein phosphatase 1 regulatory subunit 3D [Toxocara canis]|uniref:Protein phosphatase 1 regulatory subunit 3D n=1 Tax=Toxocara canis TaxID=6265 RepID=A0A0B2W4L5_TOXCA|nr:Protein phosphatase 1 regulatory subunit 3D [Toxocara canis]